MPLDAWGLLLIVLAGAILAAVAFARVLARPRGAAAPPGPVPVPPEEIELGEGPVRACMRCGYPLMRNPRLSEGLVPGFGEGLVYVCGRCRFRGQPLVFDDPTAYRLFIQGLHADDAARKEAGP